MNRREDPAPDDPTERLLEALAGDLDPAARFRTLARLLEDRARRAIVAASPPDPLPTKETDDARPR